MKKLYSIIALFALIFALSLILKPKQMDELNITEKSLKEENSSYKVDLKYPLLSGFSDNDFEIDLNKKIQELTVDYANEIIKMAKEEEISSKENNFGFMPFEFSGSYTELFHSKKLLVIKFDTYEFTGGAHGMPYTTTFNIDLESNKILSLSDLFIDSNSGNNYIISKIEEEIKLDSQKDDSDSTKIYYFEDADVDLEFANFSILNDSIEVYFNPYNIAPYSSGMPSFSFDLKDLSDLLKDKYK